PQVSNLSAQLHLGHLRREIGERENGVTQQSLDAKLTHGQQISNVIRPRLSKFISVGVACCTTGRRRSGHAVARVRRLGSAEILELDQAVIEPAAGDQLGVRPRFMYPSMV